MVSTYSKLSIKSRTSSSKLYHFQGVESSKPRQSLYSILRIVFHLICSLRSLRFTLLRLLYTSCGFSWLKCIYIVLARPMILVAFLLFFPSNIRLIWIHHMNDHITHCFIYLALSSITRALRAIKDFVFFLFSLLLYTFHVFFYYATFILLYLYCMSTINM